MGPWSIPSNTYRAKKDLEVVSCHSRHAYRQAGESGNPEIFGKIIEIDSPIKSGNDNYKKIPNVSLTKSGYLFCPRRLACP